MDGDSVTIKRSLIQLHNGVIGSNIKFLNAPTDHRVITGVGIDQGSKDTSSGTNSLSRELDEAMDIDSLVDGACKKRKTTTRAVHIGSASE
ncbi:hypothetical protein GOBAR_DD06357 [Gossypium barbadense]|nr:hypothetical protein GOBAR_DD06357 [Gossypium barbadense]